MKSILNDDLHHVEVVVGRIEEARVDITKVYQDWVEIGFAFASLGEIGRDYFIRISQFNEKYKNEDCDQKFTNCLKTRNGSITLATFFQLAKNAGIDINMHAGRHKKQKDDKPNKMEMMENILKEQAEFRYNTWTNRAEIKTKDAKYFRPINDRDLSTLYCYVKGAGVNISCKDVSAMIESRDFCKDYDPIDDYLCSLKPWDGKTDYIEDMFSHIIFEDEENRDFYMKYLKMWFVCSIALWKGYIEENPLMPVLCGEQHKGKTYFVKQILPPELRPYLYQANPMAHIDKDFIISVSEFCIIFLDEFSISSNSKSDAYKFLITSGKSHERDAYSHYREARERKASLIAATNINNYIKDIEGSRRYLSIKVKSTLNFNEHPIDYAGIYAQGLYLLEHGDFKYTPSQEESMELTEHNKQFLEPDDCEELIKIFFRKPKAEENYKAFYSNEIYKFIYDKGYHNNNITVSKIGKAMKRIGFESKFHQGRNVYLVVELEGNEIGQAMERKAEELQQQECNIQNESKNSSSMDAGNNSIQDNNLPF